MTPPAVALTFDDGPDSEGTPAVLDSLARAGAAATFFVLVERAAVARDLVARILAEGHQVGLHGDRHEAFDRLPIRTLRQRLCRARAELEDLTGTPIRLHRPPYGRVSWRSFQATRQAGLDLVYWSRDPRDWDPASAATLGSRIAASLRPGAVVLLHDGSTYPGQGTATAAALDRALPALRAAGLQTAMLAAG